MLLKIKGIRRELREFYGLRDFTILLNSNKFQIALRGGEKPFFFATFKAGMLLKTKEAQNLRGPGTRMFMKKNNLQ
jgi:hypothetical protein